MARILVVDDSQVIRDLLTDFLTELGHDVDLAVDGAEGLTKAMEGTYDLCICDLHLPKINGFELMSKLGPEKDQMQFVFTDSLPDDLYEQIKETTRYQCIRKPFDLTQFREILDLALEKVRPA